MLEKNLTPRQRDRITEIKKIWLEEAEPYLEVSNQNEAVLDGSNSIALAQIQMKYKKKIKEVMEAPE